MRLPLRTRADGSEYALQPRSFGLRAVITSLPAAQEARHARHTRRGETRRRHRCGGYGAQPRRHDHGDGAAATACRISGDAEEE